jgi:hypothetical protein
MSPTVAIEWEAFVIPVLEVPVSNLGSETGYADRVLVVFLISPM